MTRAFADVFNIRDGFTNSGIAMNGRTDAWIFAQLAAQHGVAHDEPSLSRFHDAYVKYLAEEVVQPGPRKGILPGVRPLLEALAARDDAYVALLTGNFETGARIKLEYFDLWRYFRCGAFGDRAQERNGLLTTALERVKACGGPQIAAADVVIVGDTPFDVAVAVAGGARSLAVATGGHDVPTLRDAGADAVLPDLSDLSSVLQEIGFDQF
jgi:phosphoglycolate phosphatase-like HAD superfamily hydrolase